MMLRETLLAPLARVGLWLPLGTLAAFGLLAAGDLLAFPDAVLAVTVLAAVGWVAVGFGGDRLVGPFDPDAGGVDPGGDSLTGAIDATTGVLTYLTATTALGWVAVRLFVGL